MLLTRTWVRAITDALVSIAAARDAVPCFSVTPPVDLRAWNATHHRKLTVALQNRHKRLGSTLPEIGLTQEGRNMLKQFITIIAVFTIGGSALLVPAHSRTTTQPVNA